MLMEKVSAKGKLMMPCGEEISEGSKSFNVQEGIDGV